MPYPYQFIKLTEAQRRELKDELKRLAIANKHRIRRRLQAIYYSDKGKTFKQISNILDVSYRSVKMWVHTYRQGGFDVLKGRK
ncbi:MAG: helix-turn-helix domain-containing protein [Planctomycetes bacterium]|nr:helix-turn-helix domain-containing protein [Planctomycetota bacterium]